MSNNTKNPFTNKAVIEMSLADFLKLRVIICNLYQLGNDAIGIKQYLKADSKHWKELEYLKQGIESIDKEDLEFMTKLISYDEE